jgi:hypothetical protein
MEVNPCIRGSTQDPSVHSFIVASLQLPLPWYHDLNSSRRMTCGMIANFLCGIIANFHRGMIADFL